MVRRRIVALEDARLLAEHHIAGVRYTRRGRRISHVLHPAFGWLTIRDYYLLQKVHDLLPFLQELVHGGYRLKQVLWGIEINASILGTGIDLPIGLAIPGIALAAAALAAAQGDYATAAMLIALVALPFGDLVLLAMYISVGIFVFTGAGALLPKKEEPTTPLLERDIPGRKGIRPRGPIEVPPDVPVPL